MKPQFSIGQQFKTRGKDPKVCTIVDIWSTYNAAGEQVRLRYLATHEFMGQKILDRDVPETAIAMGLIDTVTSKA